jgi:hypothetical protein
LVEERVEVDRRRIRVNRHALHVHAARVAPERFTLEDVLKDV